MTAPRNTLSGAAQPAAQDLFPARSFAQEWMEMKTQVCTIALLSLALPLAGWFAPASFAQSAAPAGGDKVEIGGQKVITLTRTPTSTTKPEFTSITLLPGRALLIQQVTANFPGKGNVDVLASPDLAGSKKLLEQDDDQYGNQAFRLGAAFLFPYPNRMRGKLSADGKIIDTEWQGKALHLPASWHGSLPTAEVNSMHGLILKRAIDEVSVKEIPGGQEVTGIIHGGDFGGHWLSKTDLVIKIALRADAIDVSMTAKNVGTEAEPVAFAWHPYFNIPSGDRTQARLVLPAGNVAEVDNYDNVFPTGKLDPVAGSKFDFNGETGKALGDLFMDDNFGDLKQPGGVMTVKVIDPKAKYGVAIEGLSHNIKAIQVYAPPTKNFIAIEHQTIMNDPLGKQWGKLDTGLITVEPGKTADWHVRLKVFVP
jgi:galactose mutarotase-like enzyme